MRPRHHPVAARRRGAIRSVSALAIVGLANAALADSTPPSAQAPGPLGLTWQGQNLLGDMGGLRPALAEYGVTLTLLENVETFGNLSGGVKQGFEADGLTTVTLQMDTEKAFGLKGGTLNASGLQYWGGNLSTDNLMVLQTLTDIEAPVGVRLWELWYQQKFCDKFDLKIGEQSLDEEFTIAPTANTVFINSVSGWPALPASNLPGGGPAYPLAGLGIRARARLTDSVTVLAGVFNGSPIPRDSPERGDEQSPRRELPARHGRAGHRRGCNMRRVPARRGRRTAMARCRAITRSAPGTTAPNSTTSRSTR